MKEWLWESIHMAGFIGSIGLGVFYKLPQSPQGPRRPVVLVPGLLGRGLEFYKLRQALIEAGYPVYIPDLGFQAGEIAPKFEQLDQFLTHHQLQDFYLIGYSLGAWVAQGIMSKWESRVYRFITLGVAFEGTKMGWCLPLKAAYQLREGSALVRQQALKNRQLHPRHINLYAQSEEIVLPLKSSLAPKAYKQHQIPIKGHLNLVLHSKSIQTILGHLAHEDSLSDLSQRFGVTPVAKVNKIIPVLL